MKSNWFKNNWLILVTGLVIGIAALVLGVHGNPGNMGFCIACFLRDTTGALGLHGAEVVRRSSASCSARSSRRSRRRNSRAAAALPR